MTHVDIVFTEVEPPEGYSGPCLAFVEVDDEDGASTSIGEWVDRGDEYEVLRVPRIPPSLLDDLRKFVDYAAFEGLEGAEQLEKRLNQYAQEADL